jgi:choline dehydrogenase
MRSGIGPAADLARLGIKPLVDLPAVGTNLADHPLAIIRLALRPNARASSLQTAPYGCGLRMTSSLAQSNDLGMYAGGVGESVAEGVLGVAVMQPFSRGRVTIVSSDPVAEPLVEFEMLEDGRDLDRLRAGVRHAIEIVRHRAFSAVLADLVEPSDEVLADDAALTSWLINHCDAHVHPGGTCGMGSSQRAVVDPQCKVIGVSGLRVIDASIVPRLPRAATHLTTVMIAEHMAERLAKNS